MVFPVVQSLSVGRLQWTCSVASDEKEAITAVQTIRNALMVCGLFATACAYIGARALPDLLLNDAYSINLDKLAMLDPISGRSHGHVGLIHPSVKGGIALGIIFCTFVLFGQAARYYIHLGYIVKIVSSKHNQKNWQLQDEALSLMQRAGFIFSLAMRSFFAFGLVVLYYLGPTSLFVSTITMTSILYWTDHLPVTSYEDVLQQIDRQIAIKGEVNLQDSTRPEDTMDAGSQTMLSQTA
ncbi:hypothetical protein WJX74_007344 [Apatococcus lobatus]|uniref:Uncharacterized protein n=1 Tax=Apatococcus lobatus TaxID=904363 RepID=A0AAW1Q136_9CHLO